MEVNDWAGLSHVVSRSAPDVVFHLAAIVDTVTTPDLEALYATNTMGTASLLDAVRRADGVERVVVASSALAYGRVDAGADRVREAEPLRPVSAYGASKAAAEAIALQWWRETGTELVVARAFQQTGPGHTGAYALADWARQLAAGAAVLHVGNLDVTRDYLDVRDVAAAYLALADRGRPGDIYNIASGVPRTMREMLEGLVAAFGRPVDIRSTASRLRPSDQSIFVADVSKVREHTGWGPKITLERTLSDLAASARAISVGGSE